MSTKKIAPRAVETSPREVAAKAAEDAAERLEQARALLVQHQEAYEHATITHSERRDENSSAGMTFAANDVRASKAAVTAAERALTAAKVSLAKILRQEAEAAYRVNSEIANAVQAKLSPIFQQIATLERHIADHVEKIADVVTAGGDAYAIAEGLARELGRSSDFRNVRRVTTADARLACQEALEAARAKDDVVSVADWLSPSGSHDWRLQGLSAGERVEQEAFTARQKASAQLAEREAEGRAAFQNGVLSYPALLKLEQERLAAEKAKAESQKTEGGTAQ